MKSIIIDGLWKNNPALVQLLGLCPLLAVSQTAVNGLGLGLATTMVLVGSNVIVSLIRNWVRKEVRIPVFVLVIAALVTSVELLLQAFMFGLYDKLGIFIALIVTNCSIIGRAEAFASKNPVGRSFVDGLMMGLGFAIVLTLLGAMREIVGSGTLFANAHLMFGDAAKDLTIVVIQDYKGFLLAILPPGAFLGLGLLISIKNIIDDKMSARTQQVVAAPAAANPTAS
jgi:electron transport complex protein RnfE